MSLISLLNSSIIVNKHQHPLIYCYTKGRNGTSWRCNGGCNNNFTMSAPTFYCTLCDFDLCPNCLQQYRCFDIHLFYYNSQFGQFLKNQMNAQNNKFNWQLKLPCHKHPMTLIQKVNQNQCYIWKCSNCKSIYNNNEPFNYCSLCDYYLCRRCSTNVPEYFSIYNK